MSLHFAAVQLGVVIGEGNVSRGIPACGAQLFPRVGVIVVINIARVDRRNSDSLWVGG
jgi:hypothetical protein